ncbi:MAG: hypothetical protein Q8S73_41200 [Deltaproteobacteria bacterium]|nr:hypothetical protein [Myxococcales bacterium]MDP3220578.1 hypothetical protein [Deltaproteobacteria bacterium]
MILPQGHYRARIAQRGWDKTQNGDPQYVVEFVITHGREVNARVLLRTNFSEKAAKFSIERLRRLGWRGWDLATLDAATLAEEHTIEISHREYEGKTYLDVDVVAWIPKPGALSPDYLAALADRMRRVIAETDRRLGLPEEPAPPEPAREPGADDDFA